MLEFILEFLPRILGFLGILWLLRRLLRFFLPRRARRTPSQPPSTGTVKDPVCGMYMDPRLSIRAQTKDGEIFFCSEDCRDRYLNEAGKRMPS